VRPWRFCTPLYDVHRIRRLATEYQSAGTSPEADIPIGVPALLGNKLLGLLDRPVKQSDEAEKSSSDVAAVTV
jgi:hypothetical protein